MTQGKTMNFNDDKFYKEKILIFEFMREICPPEVADKISIVKLSNAVNSLFEVYEIKEEA